MNETRGRVLRRPAAGARFAAALLAALCGKAMALHGKIELSGDNLDWVLNSSLTAGLGIRTQSPSAALIAKTDLNPSVCTQPYQSCIGLFRTQLFKSQHIVAAPGGPLSNGDQGDLNYGKYDLIQAPLKLTEDLTLKWRDFSVFTRVLYFYDEVNRHFTEYNPNLITAQNLATVGRAAPLYPGGRVYGPGGPVYFSRSDGETLREAGSAWQFLDSYVADNFTLYGWQVGLRIGRQTVNWGESTTLLLNSLSQSNPINANNVYRIGSRTEEYFIPLNQIVLDLSDDRWSLSSYYKFEWQSVELPAPGTFFSDLDIGSHDAGRYLTLGLGSAADPQCLGVLGDSPLALTTNTCSSIYRLPDWEARSGGQYGVNLGYYAENLGNGTQFNLSYQHYHSQLPYVSFFSTYPSCARSAGNPGGIDATNFLSLLQTCPDLPLNHFPNHDDPASATSSVAAFDSIRFVFEYPEDIDLLGLSFNTAVGDWSVQGELAYRPNKPLQVDAADLGYAAFGPTLTHCNDAHSGPAGNGCSGSRLGLGISPSGGVQNYGSSDLVDAQGNIVYRDTLNLAGMGALPSAARAFPNFVIPYRGGSIGENAACYPQGDPRHHAYDRNSPCYIRGYERFADLNFNFSATRIWGASQNWLGADQLILTGEAGAEWVPNLPALDVLPLQGPGNSRYNPTAGADGSGADGSRRACAGASDCSYGPDGLRFNPHQQDASTFPTAFSYGFRGLLSASYENTPLPSIGLHPSLLYKQDVSGIAPAPGGNFIAGRKEVDLRLETRYRSALSLTLGYTWFWGGGANNTLSDRDYLQLFMRYQF